MSETNQPHPGAIFKGDEAIRVDSYEYKILCITGDPTDYWAYYPETNEFWDPKVKALISFEHAPTMLKMKAVLLMK